ncbi:phage repressor protein CI [[Pasteurella] aerogenes]
MNLWLIMQENKLIGGKGVLDRIQKSYGFSKRKDLGDYLGISPSTFSTWVSREFFPSDLVIRCAKETGARLDYVAYGIEPIFDEISDLKYFQVISIENGKFFINGVIPFFISALPKLESREAYEEIFAVKENQTTYFVNKAYGNLMDGEYFVVIENSYLIRYITVLPGGKIRVDGGKFSFEANVSDIEIAGKVILKMEKF